MEKSRFFRISVHESARKTTSYFSTLVKVFGLLILFDRYLLTSFRGLKKQVFHALHNETFGDSVSIVEGTAYDGAIGATLGGYLRTGKELFLTSLSHIETTADLDALLKKLSNLVYDTQEELKSNDFLDVLTHSSLDKVALARNINYFWLYFANSGATAPITLESVSGSPKIAFSKKPPLREWLPTVEEKTQTGRLELRHIDFGDRKKWKAVLFDYLHDRPLAVEIKDPKFLENLKSTEENEANGILHGDILLAQYTIINDALFNKITIKILEVHKHLRQSKATQLDLFGANSEPSLEHPVEKPQKSAKKKHSSWH